MKTSNNTTAAAADLIANKLGIEVGQKLTTTKADAAVRDAIAGRYDIAGLNALLKKLDVLILNTKALKYNMAGIIKLYLHQDLGEKKGQIKVAMLDSERLFKIQTGQSCYPKGGFRFEIETSKNGFRTALSGKMNITLEFYDSQGNHLKSFGLNSVMYAVQSKAIEITVNKVKKAVNQFEAFTQARVLELAAELQAWQAFEVKKAESDRHANDSKLAAELKKLEKDFRALEKTKPETYTQADTEINEILENGENGFLSAEEVQSQVLAVKVHTVQTAKATETLQA